MNDPQVLGTMIIDPSFLFVILKGMVLIGFGLYVIFAFAVIRQIALMTRTLQTGANGTLRVFGWVHFFVSLCIWLLALLIL